MTVKELIEVLNELPQDAEVYYMAADGGLHDVTSAQKIVPDDEELKGIVGDEFVYLK